MANSPQKIRPSRLGSTTGIGSYRPGRPKEVELSIKCRDLKDMDKLKSDPRFVMYEKDIKTDEWQEYGRKDAIYSNLNPDFKTTIDHFFGEKQELKFEVYDIDSSKTELSKQECLGEAFCTLDEIVRLKNRPYEAPLSKNGKTTGRIIIRGEVMKESYDMIYMKWEGMKLDKADLFGKPNPFLVISRRNEDNSHTFCAKTISAKNTVSPKWDEIEISSQKLCNGDWDRTLSIEVFDSKANDSHVLIGSFETSLRRLDSSTEDSYECKNKEREKKKNYKNSGLISLTAFRIERHPSFLEYIRSGTEMSFIVAIDFTSSNRDPHDPDSLHYIHPTMPNQYQIAIEAVGDILQHYDTDQLFPAYGFGACLPPDDEISHMFPINFNLENPDCVEVQGVMEAYKSCLRQITLDGPTNLAPIIRTVSENAASVSGASEYYVLLIITDGVISDMEATKEAIVKAAKFPMSIIIVGVGDEDFTAMEILDGDNVRLSFRNEEAERDIVQFVPLREHMTKDGNEVMSKARVARSVLEEVPDQLIEYMRKRNLKPKENKKAF